MSNFTEHFHPNTRLTDADVTAAQAEFLRDREHFAPAIAALRATGRAHLDALPETDPAPKMTPAEKMGYDAMVEMNMSAAEFAARWPLSAYARYLKRNPDVSAPLTDAERDALEQAKREHAGRMLKRVETCEWKMEFTAHHWQICGLSDALEFHAAQRLAAAHLARQAVKHLDTTPAPDAGERVTFQAGSVDYDGKPETEQLLENIF